MKKILIIGATSAIATAAARLWAGQGHSLYLLGRNEERMHSLAADLKIRGASSVRYALLDVNQLAQHRLALENAATALGVVDVALIAHGTLGDQQSSQSDIAAVLHELNTNAISVISLLTGLANLFETQKQGTIAVIGSVAGDRGRASNYVYGTAKAAVAVFMQGLRNRLHGSGVHVLTVKPGFVDTPMTARFKKGLLWASPERVARGILSAIDSKAEVAYVPGFWRAIMWIVKVIPESIFKRLSL